MSEIRADVALSTGAIVRHSGMANGAQSAEVVGRAGGEMTNGEWDEYCAIIAGVRRESQYAACIRVAPAWTPAYDVRHVEGFIRLERSALDALHIWQFASAVKDAVRAIDLEGRDVAEQVAKSFGL